MLPTTLPVVGTTAINYGSCGFSGTIPTEFGLLTGISGLHLDENYLSGTIPTEFGLLTALDIGLTLSGNELTGPIPTVLGLLTAMSELDLSDNDLRGTMPSSICNLVTNGSIVPGYCNLAHNPFTCPLPQCGAACFATCNPPL